MLKVLTEDQVMDVIKLAHALRGDPRNPATPFNTDPDRPLKTARPSSLGAIRKPSPEQVQRRVALVEYLDALSPDQRRELMALMWVGRGDADWAGAMRNARGLAPEGHVSYLTGKGPLGDYLTEGLVKLKSPG